MIGLKVKSYTNITKAISIIRKYDKNLSMGEIKSKIEQKDIVIFHDVSGRIDIVDELNGVDKNVMFCQLIEEFEKNGREIELYDEDDIITIEILHNKIERWNQICEDTQLDIDRELGEE